MADIIRPWFEGVRLHPDVESGKLTMATFAIDFGGVLANSAGVPLIYRDSKAFWQATYLTYGVTRLLEEALTRLSKPGGDRVLQLRSPFGGGKSHVLVALFHAVKDPQSFQQLVAKAKDFPKSEKAKIAGIDGEKFDPTVGTDIKGIHVRTLWGALAAHLDCYEIMDKQEKTLIAPGGEEVKKMLDKQPTLILLDEVLRYVERALGITVGETNLGRLSLEFLQTLTTEVASSTNAAIIYSLQASGREALDNISLLTQLDHLAARVDAKREPVIGDEILDVLKKRLLAEPPKMEFAKRAGTSIAQVISNWKAAEAPDDLARRAAQDESVKKAERIESAFPFHVALIDLMKERWASIPDFKRTRGALRFLAAVLHKTKQLGRQSYLIGPGDIPLDDPDVKNAFFTEVGQREVFQAVLDHDITGPNARSRRIDQQLSQQDPALQLVRPATRLAIAILMYSFGGVQRQESNETIPPGVSEKELLEATLGPDLDNITAQTVLKRLREECLFLHFDGIRYSFKTTPNVNKMVEDESENIGPNDTRNFISSELEKRIGSITNAAIIWPQSSSEISDKEPRFILAYLPIEFSEKSEKEKNEKAIEYLTKIGTQLRRFRNGIGLAIADKRQLDGIRRATKYIIAVENVKKKKTVYRLTQEQKDQLKEREDTERSAFESSMRILYNEIWLLKMQDGQPAIDRVSIGGRPMKNSDLHQRLLELLMDVSQKLFDKLTPSKIIDLMKMGKGESQLKAIDTKVLRDSFFQTLDFTRITDQKVIADAIAKGVQTGLFCFALKSRVREELNRWLVDKLDAIILRRVSAEEIDLESGYILIPDCIVEPEMPSGAQIQPTPVTTTSEEALQTSPPASIQQSGSIGIVRKISIELSATKQLLYKTFNALGNLAEKAGSIRISIHAEKSEGFERNWLRNAVKEPLEEGGIDAEIKED